MRKYNVLPRFLWCTALLLVCSIANAAVRYDEGRLDILGVQLFQEFADANKYYYLPQYPRLSEQSGEAVGDVEFLFIKYIGTDINGTSTTSGGLLHALVDFRLPPELEAEIREGLAEIAPAAQLVGPIPLNPVDEDELGMASFRIVSATLSNEKFKSNVISSGRAPLTPGSKAAIAANLDQTAATLLWDSFENGNTSDVSIAVSGSYDAVINSYNAKITASTENIYRHVSRIQGYQEGFNKRELRKIVDDMRVDQILNIEAFDQGQAFGLNNAEMDSILSLVTDKLTEIMFDRETGWAREPEKEAVEPTTPRRKRGWLGRLFRGSGNQKYVSDDKFVLKKVENIKFNSFVLNLNRDSTIRIPYDSTGNLGNFYTLLAGDGSEAQERHFRVVNLNDTAFDSRSVRFLIDGDFVSAFTDRINAVSFQYQRPYANGNNAFQTAAVFDYQTVSTGAVIKDFFYPRAGDPDDAWLNEFGSYRVVWNLRDIPKPLIDPSGGGYTAAAGTAITLTPPFTKTEIQLFADLDRMRDAGVQRGSIKFATVLAGKTDWVATAEVLANSADSMQTVTIYHDRGEVIIYEATWYALADVSTAPRKVVEGDYLYLAPEVAETDTE